MADQVATKTTLYNANAQAAPDSQAAKNLALLNAGQLNPNTVYLNPAGAPAGVLVQGQAAAAAYVGGPGTAQPGPAPAKNTVAASNAPGQTPDSFAQQFSPINPKASTFQGTVSPESQAFSVQAAKQAGFNVTNDSNSPGGYLLTKGNSVYDIYGNFKYYSTPPAQAISPGLPNYQTAGLQQQATAPGPTIDTNSLQISNVEKVDNYNYKVTLTGESTIAGAQVPYEVTQDINIPVNYYNRLQTEGQSVDNATLLEFAKGNINTAPVPIQNALGNAVVQANNAGGSNIKIDLGANATNPSITYETYTTTISGPVAFDNGSNLIPGLSAQGNKALATAVLNYAKGHESSNGNGAVYTDPSYTVTIDGKTIDGGVLASLYNNQFDQNQQLYLNNPNFSYDQGVKQATTNTQGFFSQVGNAATPAAATKFLNFDEWSTDPVQKAVQLANFSAALGNLEYSTGVHLVNQDGTALQPDQITNTKPQTWETVFNNLQQSNGPKTQMLGAISYANQAAALGNYAYENPPSGAPLQNFGNSNTHSILPELMLGQLGAGPYAGISQNPNPYVKQAAGDIYNFLSNTQAGIKQAAATPYNPGNPLSTAYYQNALGNLALTGENFLGGKYLNVPADIGQYTALQRQIQNLQQQKAVSPYFKDVANLLIGAPLIATGAGIAPGALALGTAAYTGLGALLSPQGRTPVGALGNAITGATISGATAPISAIATPYITAGVSSLLAKAGFQLPQYLADNPGIVSQIGGRIIGAAPQSASGAFNIGNFFVGATALTYLNNGVVPSQDVLVNAYLQGAALGATLPIGAATGQGLAASLTNLGVPSGASSTLGLLTKGSVPGLANVGIGLATGSQVSPAKNFLIGFGAAAAPDVLKTIVGGARAFTEYGASKAGLAAPTSITTQTPQTEALAKVADLLPDSTLKNIVNAGVQNAGYEPIDTSQFTPAELRSILAFNPELFSQSGQIFEATIPKQVYLNDIKNGLVSERTMDIYLKNVGVDTATLDLQQKAGMLYDKINSEPDPSFLMVRGYTLGNSFDFTPQQIRDALYGPSESATGATLIHISPDPGLNAALRYSGITYIKPGEYPQYPRSQYASGLSLYTSAPGQYSTGDTTSLGYAKYAGSFENEPQETTNLGKVGTLPNQYYGTASPFRFYPEDFLQRQDFAVKDLNQPNLPNELVNYIQSTGKVPDAARNFDFFYTTKAAQSGQGIQTPVPEYYGKGELEAAEPILGTKVGGSPYTTYTVTPNQGFFSGVPLLQNLFPEFVRGSYTTSYQVPATPDEIAGRLKTAFPQEFEAVKTSSILDSLKNYQPFIRDAARIIPTTDDGTGVYLVHEIGRPYFSLAGGGVIEGEDPLTAAIRETQEEIGIKLNPAQAEQVAENYKGTTKTFIKSGAPFQDNTDTWSIPLKEGADLNPDGKEIDMVLKYKPGLNIPLDTDTKAMLINYYSAKGIDINQLQNIAPPEKIIPAFDLDGTLIDSNGNLRPYMAETLQYLDSKGIKYGIITHSTSDDAYSKIENAGLDPNQFSQIITREDYTNSPNPSTYKPITDYGFTLLIDNDPIQIAQQISNGNYAIKASSSNPIQVLNTIRAISETDPKVTVIDPVSTPQQLQQISAPPNQARYETSPAAQPASSLSSFYDPLGALAQQALYNSYLTNPSSQASQQLINSLLNSQAAQSALAGGTNAYNNALTSQFGSQAVSPVPVSVVVSPESSAAASPLASRGLSLSSSESASPDISQPAASPPIDLGSLISGVSSGAIPLSELSILYNQGYISPQLYNALSQGYIGYSLPYDITRRYQYQGEPAPFPPGAVPFQTYGRRPRIATQNPINFTPSLTTLLLYPSNPGIEKVAEESYSPIAKGLSLRPIRVPVPT